MIMMAMSVRTNFLRGQRLFPWHGPFLAGDRADEYAGLHATGAGRSALLNYIFFVRTFDLALGNRLCARPGTGRRIAIKPAEALEHMEKVDTLVVDKTGMLTEGKPRVTAIVPIAGLSESEILPLAASLERSSEHPLAAAIVTAARDRNASIQEPTDFASVMGKGVTGKIGGRLVALGNAKLMADLGITLGDLEHKADLLRSGGATALFLAVDGKPGGVIAIAAPIKSTTQAALDSLRKDGIRIVMLTGDNKTTAAIPMRMLPVHYVSFSHLFIPMLLNFFRLFFVYPG